ncbi:Protocatechuate 4,5-dioxygenase alpha chain [Pigmentiphaga humi]|uniref:Protocatechuate 4,5-dioxygenase alpha chain n=1 Tax=Pigmentiphaga humi TaxID=2478468 RepID=A0A3P4AZ96_9BURK|nr:protocatechuate 3,4-dioxygenase [Pigmentiphaga humi]VCU68696.1 Protocatechuate 4,5-dioxygenase alpha chain [Pigmentiphaga humi]
MTTPQRDRSRPISRSLVFDLQLSWKGYRINKMCNSLTDPANRAAYKENEEAYMERFGLTEAQKELVRARDFTALLDAGANVYFLLKLGVVTGIPLYAMGAQMRGETYEAFLATRNDKGAT